MKRTGKQSGKGFTALTGGFSTDAMSRMEPKGKAPHSSVLSRKAMQGRAKESKAVSPQGFTGGFSAECTELRRSALNGTERHGKETYRIAWKWKAKR